MLLPPRVFRGPPRFLPMFRLFRSFSRTGLRRRCRLLLPPPPMRRWWRVSIWYMGPSTRMSAVSTEPLWLLSMTTISSHPFAVACRRSSAWRLRLTLSRPSLSRLTVFSLPPFLVTVGLKVVMLGMETSGDAPGGRLPSLCRVAVLCRYTLSGWSKASPCQRLVCLSCLALLRRRSSG